MLRNTASIQHIDANSYFSITGWAVQTLRVNDVQGMQPVALPEIDYRRRIDEDVTGGHFMLQLNTLALTRSEGQDTQRAFASLEWDLRKLTRWGQEVTFTAFARGDLYNTSDVAATDVLAYRGLDGLPRARDRGAGGRCQMAVRRFVPGRDAALSPRNSRSSPRPASTTARSPTRIRARSTWTTSTCSRSTAFPVMTGSRIRAARPMARNGRSTCPA